MWQRKRVCFDFFIQKQKNSKYFSHKKMKKKNKNKNK
jgi:hypothetical protein